MASDVLPNERLSLLNIVLLGMTGTGKSSLGNTLLASNEFRVEINQNSVTTNCIQKTCLSDGYYVNIIDTPGFFDTNKDFPEEIRNEQTKDEVTRCIRICPEGIHAFLFVISGATRFTSESLMTLDLLKDYFGCADLLNYVHVIFTHKDELDRHKIGTDEFLTSKLTPELTSFIESINHRVHFVNNVCVEDLADNPSDLLLAKIDGYRYEIFDSIKLHVEENLNGKLYTSEYFEAAQQEFGRLFQTKVQDSPMLTLLSEQVARYMQESENMQFNYEELMRSLQVENLVMADELLKTLQSCRQDMGGGQQQESRPLTNVQMGVRVCGPLVGTIANSMLAVTPGGFVTGPLAMLVIRWLTDAYTSNN